MPLAARGAQNCVYYLGTAPVALNGFAEAEAPTACAPGEGVGGIASFGKVEPRQMVELSACASLLSQEAATGLTAQLAKEEHPSLTLEQVYLHLRVHVHVHPCPRVYVHVYSHALLARAGPDARDGA